jgi:transcriptional regulator GlxA family with amidase domain
MTILIGRRLMKTLSTVVVPGSKTSGNTPSLSTLRIPERRLRQVVEMLESDPASSIRDLALKVSLSRAHLQRLFKQQTGVQLGSFVAETRLQKAAQLLTLSNLSIKQIAHAVGYRHHSSFVRAFQRRFSETPKHYRSQDDDKSLGTE